MLLRRTGRGRAHLGAGHWGYDRNFQRRLLIGDVDKLYEPRERDLKPKPMPHDAPLSERRRKPTPEDIERMILFRDVQIEKQSLGVGLYPTLFGVFAYLPSGILACKL